MSNHEDRRVAGGVGPSWPALLVIALVLMVVAVFFFGTGLRDGFIETVIGRRDECDARGIRRHARIVLGVLAGRTTRFVRPRGFGIDHHGSCRGWR